MKRDTADGQPTAPWQVLSDSNDFPNDFANLFDGTFLNQLAAHAGPDADKADLLAGVEIAVRAYLHARLPTPRVPGKLETQRLEAVADHAHTLTQALAKVRGSRNAERKLANALEAATHGGDGRGAGVLALARQHHGPGDPLRALHEIIAHLSSAAAGLVDKAPGASSDDRNQRAEAIYERERADWAPRKRARPVEPFEKMAEAFRPFWERNSDHPFTPGMYHKEAGQTVSPVIDALHMIALKLDLGIPRSRPSTAVRNINSQTLSSTIDS